MKLRICCCFIVLFSLCFIKVEPKCSQSCDLALASYFVWPDATMSIISTYMNVSIPDIISYNAGKIPNQDSVQSDTRINIPFPCGCIEDSFLGHTFTYAIRSGDTYDKIASDHYSNLTTLGWLQRYNSYNPNNIPNTGTLNVTVNCSCGNSSVSKDYGLFITYPLRSEDTLDSIATVANLSASLIRSYNPGVDFSSGSGLVYIPGKDENGNYPPLSSSPGRLSGGAIAGISIAVISIGGVLILLLGIFIWIRICQKNKVKGAILPSGSQQLAALHGPKGGSTKPEAIGQAEGASPGITGITVDKSVEFSYEELANATDNFSLANKIGKGGFGVVYYAELRGEKAAIKKMDKRASREFLAELKVLTHVHHLNLVRLIGYCVEGSLFLVYEYIENGNLSQHLRGTAREPLPWSTRVQIALDSARGLEYIHEHTNPVYIHRDIKSENILIDKNFHGKVADFGLTKLTEVGSGSLLTRLGGTFGYMPPEYALGGNLSPKVDVYAFGVVLYELISAKEAIVKTGSSSEYKGLAALFEEVLNPPDTEDDLLELIDPRLGHNYPLESVRKMAQLAKACTQGNPQLRPSMRSVVVALTTLSTTTGNWDVGLELPENYGPVVQPF